MNAQGYKEFIHNYYLGSVRHISNECGAVIWSRDYYPFGKTRLASGTNELNAYTYEGKFKDLETDLWYNTARYFNDQGRFTQVDPMWAKYPSLSPYVRVANNPLKLVDPTGKVVEFTNEEDAKKVRDELNQLHGSDISVNTVTEEHSLLGIFSWTTTTFQLSTEGSGFDWGQTQFTSALFDCINSTDITFNISITSTYNGNDLASGYGGGIIDPYFGGGGADVYLSPSGSHNESLGVRFMHEVVGHGHPVTGEGWAGNATLVNLQYNGRYKRGHYGYHKEIGWKTWNLYKRKK